jgi:hypothetical protein
LVGTWLVTSLGYVQVKRFLLFAELPCVNKMLRDFPKT